MSERINETREQEVLGGFACRDREKVSQKLRYFAEQGVGKLHMVFDFDRTLTTKATEDGPDVTTWQILKGHLPVLAQREYDKLYQKYRALEIANQLDLEGALTWWRETLRLFKDNKVNLGEVEKDFLSKATARPGTHDLFQQSEEAGIPVVILSAGIKDVIDLWCRKNGISPAVVLSTKLELDEAGVITGWNEDGLIHALNKNEKGHGELSRLRAERPLTILVGDSMDDASAVEGEENVLRVRIRNPRKDELSDAESFRRETFTKFDLLIESGDFSPLAQCLEYIKNSQ